MNIYEYNLKNYLKIEGQLNVFFSEWDYCFSSCIKKELDKNPDQQVVACCKDKYYNIYDLDHPAYTMLKTEREKRYGKPDDQPPSGTGSPCEYHSPSGCRLKTHKSPICISFLCRKGIDCLRNDFQIIDYDYLGMYYGLEWTLTGDLSGDAYKEFEQTFDNMIKKLLDEKHHGTKLINEIYP